MSSPVPAAVEAVTLKPSLVRAEDIIEADIENDRLDLQYEILKMLFEGRAYFAPLKNPKKILDIGTGTGIWPIEM
ncbi:hypothetical protein LTR60_000779, partial [Cryomyces antarcticus]